MTQTATISPALEALRPGRQWVCCDSDKVPYNPLTGFPAKADDPSTWASYDEAVRTWLANPTKYAGIGREFIKEQEITGLDFDGCIDEYGNISTYVQEQLRRFNSYAEFSLKGRGIHIYVYGSLPDNINVALKEDGDKRIEAYDCKRYFIFTGKHVPGTPETIEHRQEQLLTLYRETNERRQAAKQHSRKAAPAAKQQITAKGSDTPYGLAALRKECDELATMPEGGRNHQLNISAYSMGQLVGGHELARSTAESELRNAATNAGLGEREIEKTLRSGLEDGMQSPRSAPEKNNSLLHIHRSKHTKSPINDSSNGHHKDDTPPPTTFDLCSFDADDAGNADAMNALYGHDFLWCPSVGWFYHTGTHWRLDQDGAKVKRCAIETLRRRRHAAVDAEKEAIIKCTKADEKRVNSCVSLFKTHVSVSIDVFDCDPDRINCSNGVLYLRTGELEDHHYEQRFTYCLPVPYKQTDYSEWLDFAQGVVGGGQEVLDYLQMAVGYSLTGRTSEEILFYLFGPSRSGKGSFAETLMALMPSPLSTMVDFNSFTAKREGDVSNFDLAPLKPSRMIFASESNRSQSLNPAKIKQLTGGDQIRACYKHRDFFAFRPQFKVWMMSNHPVNGDPEDDALWGRVRVIEFPNSFLGKEDKSKKSRLKDQDVLQGVLCWAVEGAKRWYALGAQGLTTPQAIVKVTQSQRQELDYVQQWLEECCDDDDDGWVANEVIFASYMAWCDSNNVQYRKSPVALSQSLKAKGYVTGKQKKGKDGKNRKGVEGLYVYPIEEGNGNDGNA